MAMIFAHRGFSGQYPENTMLAFQKAIELGAHGIETDVQLSKDGIPVLIHDETLNRTTNGSGYVRDFTLKELQQLDARWKFGNSVPLQTIPTLEEYLEYMSTKNFITNIEMKTSVYDYPGLVEKVVPMVEKFGLTDRIRYSSFNHYTMLQVKKACPKAQCGLLLDCWIVGIGEYGKRLGMQTINGNVSYFSKEIISEIQQAGMQAFVWTANEPDQIRSLLRDGVDVLIGNYPDRGLEAFHELGLKA
ncbi:MAG: glycerophosphodiester phosphodiesterase [Eubacteriales bacterium]|nr:glycerophosphodiester phosphodiesterase [Eubacteriales bacterium]